MPMQMMNSDQQRTAWITALCLVVILSPIRAHALELVPQQLTVNGNTITLQVPKETRLEFLAAIDGARFPSFGPNNEMLIGTNGSSIYRLSPPYTVSENLVSVSRRSHSTVYRDGKLFVAAENGVYVADYGGQTTSLSQSDFNRIVDFPTSGHSSRTIVKDANGTLYVAIGISFNCNDQYLAGNPPQYTEADQRGGVWRLDESGAQVEPIPYSSGLRNPIGIAFNPVDGSFWTTNAGSDDLGRDLPREIFSRLSEGSWHGMPWFQYIDGQFQAQSCINTTPPRPASDATPPSVTFAARSTPQGLAFVTGNALDSRFTGNALVSIHGSSSRNRSPKVVMVKFAGGEPTSVVDMITGFQLPDTSRFARPSGAIVGPDGHFYFTSDGGDVQGLFRLRRVVSTPASQSGKKAVPAVNSLLLDEDDQ